MPYNSPVPPEMIQEPVGLDKVLQDLVEDFNGIEWLNGHIFRRAHASKYPNQEGDNVTSPLVYMANGEYYDASINDNITCGLFFQGKGPERIDFAKPSKAKVLNSSRPLALIFWFNLETFQQPFSNDSIYTENIKEIFLRKLMKNTHVKSIDQYVDETVEEAFEGFTFAEDRQYNKHPFAALRINFTVEYKTFLTKCTLPSTN